MNAKRILVGIVTRNRADILPKALGSALGQSAPNVRVAVIDDASGDHTANLQSQYPSVDWLFRESPLGFISARNEFMVREGFDFFVSLDDDAWFVKGDEISEATKLFDADHKLAVVAFDIVSPDRPQTRERALPRSTGIFIGCGHMLRLAAVRDVGGYIPTPGNYGSEEKDLCLRMIDAGYRVVQLTGVHVWHDKTPVARDIAYQHRSGVCNDLAVAVRRAPMPLMLAIVPAKMLQHLRFSRRSGLLRPCLSGFMLFFRSLPAILQLRRPVRFSTLRKYARLSRAE